MTTIFLKKLRDQFYDWCSQLSLDEVASNEELIRTIEEMERFILSTYGASLDGKGGKR